MHLTSQGYNYVYQIDHPRADSNGFVKNAVLVCEEALGKFLPINAVTHHVSLARFDDTPSNLVICEDRGYHNTLHLRMRAFEACGKAHWRKCWYCQQWDDPKNLYIKPSGEEAIHRECKRIYLREWRAGKKRR